MGNYINEALLDACPYKKQQEESKALVGKWEKTGLLDGLNEDFQKSGMATMLENQARQLISENSRTNPSGGAGDEEWSGVALPLVRRIFGEIAAQEFVSVQPMNLPSGLVFYLDFQYGNTRMNQTSGESIHGKTGANTPSGSEAPYGDTNYSGFYGVGKYGYTVGTGSQQTATFTASSAAVTMKDINFDSDTNINFRVVTHCDTFHLDEVMGTAMLDYLFKIDNGEQDRYNKKLVELKNTTDVYKREVIKNNLK